MQDRERRKELALRLREVLDSEGGQKLATKWFGYLTWEPKPPSDWTDGPCLVLALGLQAWLGEEVGEVVVANGPMGGHAGLAVGGLVIDGEGVFLRKEWESWCGRLLGVRDLRFRVMNGEDRVAFCTGARLSIGREDREIIPGLVDLLGRELKKREWKALGKSERAL